MTEFRTALPPLHSSMDISYNDHTLCIGSCFAAQIGGRLGRLKFPVVVNPFGIVYNPYSVAKGLGLMLSEKMFQEEDLFENAGLWHSFAHHGSFSHPEKKVALENINDSLSEAKGFLNKTNRLLITLGTANVFVVKKTGEIVTNCHKLPGKEFDCRRLSVAEVVQSLTVAFENMRERLPHLEIIVTVSPVRHLRDGLIENQRSKATLVLALEEVCHRLPFVHYFPAYELLLDDLRDYRFYEADMSHPNKQAIDYIWQYFNEAYFDEKTKALCGRIATVVSASEHRPFHPQSAEHQVFLKKQIESVASLEQHFPALDFSKEMKVFRSQLLD